jgi:glyoxylase-like metal-dependent hydrolase (beta-lactamase superfamily II)
MDTSHIVYQQPQTIQDVAMTRAALAACPVAAIRIESYAERNHKTSIHNHYIQINNYNKATAGTTVANDGIQDVAWSEQDSWIVQQMTSKDMLRPFPRPFLLNETLHTSTTMSHHSHDDDLGTVVSDVYWTGHHNERSFGAIPYLVKAYYNKTDVWIMIDVPKFNSQSVRDIISLTGPNGPHYLFMTHVDDTADHELWANYFNSSTSGYCQRIFHAGDLGRYNWIGDTALEHVPILLQSPVQSSSSSPSANDNNTMTAYTLDGTLLNHDNWIDQFENGSLNTDVVILHTPGHSPGSCTLYKRRRTNRDDNITIPGVLFTGDTYAYTGTKMTGFPRYGHNMVQQNHTLLSLVMQLQQWDIVAPGHGLPRDYRNDPNAIRISELQWAQRDLFGYQR